MAAVRPHGEGDIYAKTEEGEGGTHADTWRESIPGGETSQGICPGCLCLACLAEREAGGGGERGWRGVRGWEARLKTGCVRIIARPLAFVLCESESFDRSERTILAVMWRTDCR